MILLNGDWVPVARWNVRDQVRAELATAVKFLEEADFQGLRVPGDSQTLRWEIVAKWAEVTTSGQIHGYDAWPPKALIPLLGIAQHHGLPTRLLDWSGDGKIAAYFAAIEALKRIKRGEVTNSNANHLAVWLFSLDEHFTVPTFGVPQTVGVELAPYSENDNLRAQCGIFVLHRSLNVRPDDIVDNRPLEDIFNEVAPKKNIYKFTLPVTAGAELLALLRFEGVDAGKLYPGFRGIVKGMREQQP